MHGHLAEVSSQPGQALVLFHRADVLEERHGLGDGLGNRGLHRLEQKLRGGSLAHPHGGRTAPTLAPEAGRLREHAHLQAQLLERRPLHLRQLKVRERRHSRRRVQAVALARANAAGAPASLLRGRAGDPRRLQRGHPRVRVVRLFFQPTRVDDEDDVVDGHRRLRDVRRQDNLANAAGRALEHPLLIRGWDHGVQG